MLPTAAALIASNTASSIRKKNGEMLLSSVVVLQLVRPVTSGAVGVLTEVQALWQAVF